MSASEKSVSDRSFGWKSEFLRAFETYLRGPNVDQSVSRDGGIDVARP